MNNLKQIIFGILIAIWMITIFGFSNQVADTSSKTSGNTIRIVINAIPSTKNLEENKKEEIVENSQHIVRKLAHFSIYTIGGIIIYNFIITFNVEDKRKIVYSLLIGFTYAVTDEIHQIFVSGRSGEVRDVIIDSTGVLLGIAIVFLICKLKEKRIKNKT